MNERSPLSLPVDEVTLLEDRARVVRKTKLTLPKGVHRVRVDAVTPVLVDKTLRAELDGGRVRDVRVDRQKVVYAAERGDALAELDRRIEEEEDARLKLERQIARQREQSALTVEALTRTLEELAEDAGWANFDPAESAARVDALEAEERALSERLGRAEETHRELADAIARLRVRRQAAAHPSASVRAALELDLEIDEEGTELRVEYLVPNACWRPAHRATLANEQVRFESEACIWQNTGEDWTDARLRMSTQRPSLGAAPPKLTTDQLSVTKKAEVLVVEARQQEVENTGLGAASIAQAKKRDELPGIDDGGDAMELVSTERASVPSDGRPHRVPLFAFEAPATRDLFSAPELNDAILLRSRQENRAQRPLLAGPVELVQNGGLVGRTSILYIAPGERFELGWGPDPALRVHREVEISEPESNLLGNWIRTATKVVHKVSNLGPDEKRVEIIERIPVSELEKVQIEVDADETTNAAKPDQDGFVRFLLTLRGFARDKVTLRYTIRRHSDVVGL